MRRIPNFVPLVGERSPCAERNLDVFWGVRPDVLDFEDSFAVPGR